MKVFVTGGSGLIGGRLIQGLVQHGHDVIALTRDPNKFVTESSINVQVIQGDPSVSGNWQEAVDGTDAIIHLAGENINSKRWDSDFKKLLYSSRIDSTHNLIRAISLSKRKPSHFIAASAVGWYGDTNDQWVDEDNSCGNDFLAKLCFDWESASDSLAGTDIVRTVVRFGIVLDPSAGALAQLIRPVRWGIGGPIAGGRFFMSWIHLNDLKNLIIWLLERKIGGIFNGVAPNPVTNSEFVKILANQLGRLAILPLPYLCLRIAIGEVARHVCSSQRVRPKATLEAGFHFDFPTLELAVKSLIAKA